MPTTTNQSSYTISEETSDSESPINAMTVIFQENIIAELNTLLASEEEAIELQDYWQGNPDYDTKQKTIIRQFIITIPNKGKIETVEIPGIQDLKLPGIEDLKSRGFKTDLESYWQESQDLHVNPKPSYK